MTINYLNWAKKQRAFSDNIKIAKPRFLSHWGDYSYNVSIPGKDEYGNKRIFRFQVENLFCESFSSIDGLNYDLYPRAKENAAKVLELYDGKRRYVSCVFDKIAAYILTLPDNPVVVFADQSMAKDIYDLHFSYLLDILADNDIKCLAWSQIDELSELKPSFVVIIELVSINERLKFNCEKVLKISADSTPVLTYISLLKEYDREEMEYLIEAANQHKELPTSVCSLSVIPTVQPVKIQEHDKLAEAIKEKKKDADKILTDLESNDIKWLYHFTDRSNLESIRKYGGLLSWEYCQNHGIIIPKPGGNLDSREYDKQSNLQDYVRLSFCIYHPMSFKLQLDGYDLVLLKIKSEVALSENTLFSDVNAASKYHHHGGSYKDFKMIDFSAVKRIHPRKMDPDYHKHQAEVLVKTFIPIDYIVNIDNPDLI